jgi:menaquinone-dependent protoporphyrinogen IX oxidase
MTNGPTDPSAVVEFTDWKQVDDFASSIAKLFLIGSFTPK